MNFCFEIGLFCKDGSKKLKYSTLDFRLLYRQDIGLEQEQQLG